MDERQKPSKQSSPSKMSNSKRKNNVQLRENESNGEPMDEIQKPSKQSSPSKMSNSKRKKNVQLRENESNGVGESNHGSFDEYREPGSPSNSVSTREDDDDEDLTDDDPEGDSGNTNDENNRRHDQDYGASSKNLERKQRATVTGNNFSNGDCSGTNFRLPGDIKGRRSYKLENGPKEAERPTICSPPFQGQPLSNAGLYSLFSQLWLWVLRWKVVVSTLLVLALGVFIYSKPGQTALAKLPGRANAPKFLNKAAFLKLMEKEFPSQIEDELSVFARQVDLSRRSKELNQQSVIYTLLYYNNSDTANKVGMEMALYAASKFHNSSRVFSIDGQTFNDYIDTNLGSFKSKIIETGTLLVTNVDEVNSESARKLHMICDKYTPFIPDKAAYILILKTDESLLEKNSHFEWKRCAISSLKKLWHDLEDSALDPLITRLTENVIKICLEKK